MFKISFINRTLSLVFRKILQNRSNYLHGNIKSVIHFLIYESRVELIESYTYVYLMSSGSVIFRIILNLIFLSLWNSSRQVLVRNLIYTK